MVQVNERLWRGTYNAIICGSSTAVSMILLKRSTPTVSSSSTTPVDEHCLFPFSESSFGGQ
jgi:hypothetical protein